VTDPASTSTDSAPNGVPDGVPDLFGMPLERLRAHRQRLLEESARASRWRRLVQARLDLAVDAAAPVEDLAACPASLARAVRAAPHPGCDPVEQLRQVDRARAELAGYAAQVRAELARATDELVDRYSCEPTRCLSAVPTR
jgi:hypothetical protein